MKIGITVSVSGGFIVTTTSAFAAGAAYGVLKQHSHGGGFGLDFVSKPVEEGEEWEVREKHRDGGRSLVGALTRLPEVGFEVEWSEEAAKEVVKRR